MDGVTTTYYCDGGLLISEQNPAYTIVYAYDEANSPIGMQYRDNSYAEGLWAVFWYAKNLQGDIVGIYNHTGARVVSYTYDAWGKVTPTTHGDANADIAANLNPFTYRGYYYDWDTGFYYLQSRYYDPAVGRFINADGYVSTGQGLIGNNMFAYCNNNPVMYVDYVGEFPWLFLAVVASAMISTLVQQITTYKNDLVIDKEMSDFDIPQTNQELEECIQGVLDNYSTSEVQVKVTVGENDIYIENSYLVDDKYARQKISRIISMSGYSDRTAANISAEWYGHNFFSKVMELNFDSTNHVNLDRVRDKRDFVYGITKILEIWGAR